MWFHLHRLDLMKVQIPSWLTSGNTRHMQLTDQKVFQVHKKTAPYGTQRHYDLRIFEPHIDRLPSKKGNDHCTMFFKGTTRLTSPSDNIKYSQSRF